MEQVGRVVELWRYPVKSMGGHRVAEATMGRRGVRTDRLWAVRDLSTDVLATARRLPALLTCEARFDGEPPADVGPGRSWPVVVDQPGQPGDRPDRPDADPGLPEHGWSGATLHLGDARLAVVTPTVRCVVPTRAQPGLPVDREVMRAVARRADRFAGAYAEVTAGGLVREGDEVALVPGRPPGVVRRAADRALAATLQRAVRLGA